MIRKTFKYRCYPNTGTRRRLFNVMRRAVTPVWNACIAERESVRDEYKALLDEAFCEWVCEHRTDLPEKAEQKIRREVAKTIKWPTGYDQYRHCRKRDNPQYAPYNAKMLECTIAQVDGCQKSFLALRRKGDLEARPPGQQRLHRCVSFRLSGWRPKEAVDINAMQTPAITLTGIGRIKLRLHRPIEGRVKTVTITQKNRRWYASFSCEVGEKTGACGPVSATKSCVLRDLRQEHSSTGGSDPDLGGAHNPQRGDSVELQFAFADGVFLEDSTGRHIDHPEFYFSHIERLRKLSRSLSRKKKGSRNRRKARHTLAKFHEHIRAKRDYFLWHIARFYAQNYRIVTVPTWPLKHQIHYAVDSRTAQRFCDSAYARFVSMLKHKCNEFGTELIERKDEQWQHEMAKLTAVMKREKLKVILRKTQQAVRYNYPERFRSLTTACERLTTQRICCEPV